MEPEIFGIFLNKTPDKLRYISIEGVFGDLGYVLGSDPFS